MIVKFGELLVENVSEFRVDFATFIDSRFVVSLDVVEFAARKAVENWNRGRRISRSLALETLLHYAATRQIKDALRLGVREGHNRVAAVIYDESQMDTLKFRELEFEPDYDLQAIMEHYEITKEEIEIVGLEKLPLLLRERIALFSAFGE